MRDNNRQNQNPESQNDTGKHNGPDYIAMQYRVVRVEDGWKTRKERIGAAFNNANGSICFRPTGRQVIENDIYLFPGENSPS